MALSRRFSALNGLALGVGVLAGLAAVGFRALINLVTSISFDQRLPETFTETVSESGEYLSTHLGLWVILVPVAGGLVVGAIRLMIPSAQRQGIPEVIAAVQARGGIIRGRSAWGHALISAVTVGTGGSTGREGPIGYIGAALGSSLGRRLGFSARDIRVLLGCGAAAGIAATFNAPLGGVLFALELLLPEFSTHAFIPLVLATVVGVTIAQQFLGDQTTFIVPPFTFSDPLELGIHLLLGVACGLGGVWFIKTMTRAQTIGQEMRMPEILKPAAGGLLVGLLGLGVLGATSLPFFGGDGQYHIFGTGYATVDHILSNDTLLLVVPTLLLLMFAKPLASSITIGSGGGGGVFSSSLVQGAAYGAFFGVLANHLWPDAVAPVSSYALVGMGAFYAATGRATLTTIVLMTELTDGYDIVLPIMFAAVTADAVSVALSKDSIYTIRLRKRGIHYDHDRIQSALDTVTVGEVMTRELDTLPQDMEVGEAWGRMMDLGHTGFPVVDADGRLAGVVTRRDLGRMMHEGKGQEPLGEVVSGLTITAFPNEMLHRARDRIFQQDIGRLIVVDPNDRKRVVGILTRSDVLRAEASHDADLTDTWKA